MDTDREYLLSLQAVRANASKVLDAANNGELIHFDYDDQRMAVVADFVTDVIKRDFGPDKFDQIPPHGRWQHFDVGGIARVDALCAQWKKEGCEDVKEVTRRLIDLFFVSVLLDAGAGDHWRFKEPDTEDFYTRSEGIAVASLHMFTAGAFASDASKKCSVDGAGLSALDDDTFIRYFQLSSENPMVGVSSRVQLLKDVGASLLKLPEIYGPSGRPGNIVDYLTSSDVDSKTLDYEVLWSCLQRTLIPSWPANRTRVKDQPIGDAWPLEILSLRAQRDNDTRPGTTIQPFHKLTQWLAYSLTVPFTRVLGYSWAKADLGTGLPEYRNGGLFVDLQVLRLKKHDLEQGQKMSGQTLPQFDATSDVIVEWRAMTVALLDQLYGIISDRFGALGVKLSMAQMLEAGTWKSGRELAATNRPETKSSPILVNGDGTLY
ncbi:hypothetical protein G7Z17_g3552 [Cylindrodendrum hubeiense]|uniref:DUF1688-domain-containing protein n=1 Tax=Cylindrodendrum hubeiense TaxID=595255 RepID=A0A9P5HAL7_9HYPO|nr:hypothetical protein G7Z17_g3552 [Cylindrodendrum hubeiense]